MKVKKLEVAKSNVSATVEALHKEKAVGLSVRVDSPTLAACQTADGAEFTLRFRTEEGFKKFMVDAVSAAAEIWPGVARDLEDA